MVATDIAARGIRVDSIDLITHADLPGSKGLPAPVRPDCPRGRQRRDDDP